MKLTGKILTRLLFFLGTSGLLFVMGGEISQGQMTSPTLPSQPLPPNPLEIQEPDPLFPQIPVNPENLTPQEREKILEILKQLDLQALELLQKGDSLNAFVLWNRQLRLSRALGISSEIQVLNRVGQVAWEQNQRTQIEWIRQRLQEILTQELERTPLDLKTLENLGLTFQQVRAQSDAISVYQTIIQDSRKQADLLREGEALRTLGKINIEWLRYGKAAAVYEELLQLIQSHREFFNEAFSQYQLQQATNNPPPKSGQENPSISPPLIAPPNEEETLKNLAYAHEQSRNYLASISTYEKLIALYTNQQKLDLIPRLQMLIASNYESLGQNNLASQYYQEAYALSMTVQQFSQATDALEKLANLYLNQKQWESSLKIYQMQLNVNRQSYNTYGMMMSYDKIGQVYVQLKQEQDALMAFQNGLRLANQLGYGQEVFEKKIDKINRRLRKN